MMESNVSLTQPPFITTIGCYKSWKASPAFNCSVETGCKDPLSNHSHGFFYDSFRDGYLKRT